MYTHTNTYIHTHVDSCFRYSDSGPDYPIEEAPFLTYKEQIMRPIPAEEILNVSRHSKGQV